jgi:hypothetical protein
MPFPNEPTQFKPGQSGNPSGRPVGARGVASQLRILLEVMDKKNGGEGDYGSPIAKQLIRIAFEAKSSNSDKLRALKEMTDRLEGQPDQNINMMPRTAEEIDAELTRLRNETEGD